VLEGRDELTEARTEAVAANRLKPSADAYLTLAQIELKQNRPDAAKENVDRALRLDPNNAAALDLKKTIASPSAVRPQSTQRDRP